VSCQLETLQRHSWPSSVVHHILEELPKTLDETYERILKDIGKKSSRDHVRLLLRCLAVAIRPLRVEELAEVFRRAVKFDDEGATPKRNVAWSWAVQEQAMLSACSKLVEVVNVDGSRTVTLSRFSVKAFLTSDRLAASSEDIRHYRILLKLAHTTLARACLDVLLDPDSSHSPLAKYAARHWVDHVRFENVTSDIQERMEVLFDPENPHFPNWVSIYDMDEPPPTPSHETRANAPPLYYAALCGLRSLVEWLIDKHHVEINPRGGRYVTAIHAALYKRHRSIVHLLIDHGVDVNTQYDDGSNLLQIAAQIGDPEAVRLLQSLGAQAADPNYSPALFTALINGNITETRRLLEEDVDVNARNEKRATALHISSDNGDVDLVKVLFQYGAEVNARNNDGSTPLHLASAKGNHAVVELLMEHEADVNAVDNKNSTALHRALAHQNLVTSELLIENGADVKALDDKILTLLHLALSNGNANLVKQLIQRGVDVNRRDKNNLTPLHLASAKGDSTAIKLLINEKVNLDVVDNANSTPLHHALINGNMDVAKILVEKGANVNASNYMNQIPLHLALPQKNFDLVDLLVGCGANVNSRGDNNSTPLHLASRHGPCKSVDLLLKHGGDPNLRDDSGSSPLHIASQRGAINSAERLLVGGAKVNLTDGNRKTPLHLASNNKQMARLLVRFGADAFALDWSEDMPLQHGLDVGNKQSRTLRV
jgi:ankyrin repeat protein